MSEVPTWLREYSLAARSMQRRFVRSVEEVAQENGVPPSPPENLPKGVQAVWNGSRFMFRARSLGSRDRKSLGTFKTVEEAVKAVNRKGRKK